MDGTFDRAAAALSHQTKEPRKEDFSIYVVYYFLIEYIFEDKEVDEKFLHKFEIIAILRGDLDPLT